MHNSIAKIPPKNTMVIGITIASRTVIVYHNGTDYIDINHGRKITLKSWTDDLTEIRYVHPVDR